MSTQTADRSSRWSDGGLAALAWFAPGMAGALTAGRVASCLVIGLLVSHVMRAPLSSMQAQVAKTATTRRIAEAVWSAAAVAAVMALLGLDSRSLFSAAIGLGLLWILLAVSAAVAPLSVSVSNINLGPDAIGWLPVPRRSGSAAVGKRVFDVTVSLLALTAIAPLLVVVAVGIKAHDGGPVLFKQRRIGRNGTTFEMIKFRSMVLDAEERKAELEASSDRSGPLFKMTNDPRITPIGRIIRELSIDELPQLWNIVRGDMSLVGPRPALPNEAVQFDAALQRRNLVTPGLTGLWQAEARSDADFNRFRDLDLRYVSTASPALDLWIILATASEIVVALAAIPLGAVGFKIASNDGIEPVETADVIDLRDETDNNTALDNNVIDLRDTSDTTKPADAPSPRPSAA